MTNYIPANKEDRLQLEENNILYKEIFDRRSLGRCDECEHINSNICKTCAHNSDTDIRELKISEISVKDIRRAKKFSNRPKILKRFINGGKCPCCDPSKNWTKTLIAYFSSDSGLKLGECVAKFCPICGRNLNE